MCPVYLDNNATTMVAPEVREAMLPLLGEEYGNPSSMHGLGGRSGLLLEQARQKIAAGLGCAPDEIIFTSCGTEGDNTAIFSALESQPDKKHLITTRIEHPAVLNVAKHYERKGYDVTYLSVDSDGRFDLDQYRAAFRPDTALVSVMYANNESGVISPIEEMVAIAKDNGVLFHTDAVQAVGKIPIDLKKLPVDYLVLSGHKIHGPKGIGAMFLRRNTPFRPFMLGGHQEQGRRGGTENLPGIVGIGAAMELAVKHIGDENSRVRGMRDRLEKGLMAAIPDSIINGDPAIRLPNTLSIAFKYIEGEAMLLMLDRFGICASSGSACTSGSLEPSHVLRAMGVPFTYAHGSLRFSLSVYNTEEDIDLVLKELPPIISRLRQMSPFRRGDEGLDWVDDHDN
ncbi:cysteine desulfurase NifS [Maridesulfovibrio hydrothermalis]|uniref:Cysteine desulfurase n=1 Tax=Maridesulfovibrio hydrothermalis AM13 = DSM 14728 TaxID=1121451 RepID=L0R811_9BACT|nr:cysteine desulfurase NifS [Maridesulfovibrio hydrothermalis]CCO22874.1 cysteine desulfurase (tRNA sulfurtransferase), PLP-dependent [Maridesulfovibrio hydrothermalis AM13 = DSM 14728]